MRRRRAGIAGALALAIVAIGATHAQAAESLWKVGPGSAGGQVEIPRGIAADPSLPGHVYVADQTNRRVQVFDAWGQFIRAWGWGVEDGSDEFQICTVASSCLKGATTEKPGGFGSVQGIAVDSAGAIYVVDYANDRIQKFSPTGQFLLMFGGGVNQGPVNPGDVCSAQNLAEGDSCGAGSTGEAPGEFGDWPWVGSFIAVDSEGNVSVGDKERIQKFSPAGAFIEAIEPPTIAGRGFIQSLAMDASDSYYLAMGEKLNRSEEDVEKLSSAGNLQCIAEVRNPKAIATQPGGGFLVVSGRTGTSLAERSPIEELSSNCQPVGVPVPDTLIESTGIATGAACHSADFDIYGSNSLQTDSFVEAFGPPPDDSLNCPPPELAPTISAQFATAVNDSAATVKAQINPRFWADTSYYVEYGTGKCAEGGCPEKAAFPGKELGAGIIDAEVITAGLTLTGLAPSTTYRYRFVAQSGGGGPVWGVDPDGEGPGEASFEAGLEATFTTPAPPPPAGSDGCPNAAFRAGPGARLPDCRAYEMVSPVDKDGGEILALANITGFPVRLDQAAAAGQAMTYSSYRAFADPASAPYASQYLAARGAGGWSNRSISPPREGPSFLGAEGLDGQFKAFSADLRSAWLYTDTEPVLAPGGQKGVSNLYRRDNASNGYALVSAASAPENAKVRYELQGVSADGSAAIFRSNSAQPPVVNSGASQLYLSSGGAVSPVCILPGGARSKNNCSAGTANSSFLDRAASVKNAISADGETIFWSEMASVVGQGKIYARIGGKETIEVSGAVSAADAQYWSAAADGSKAIFSIGSQLYEFDVAAEEASPIAAGFKGIAAASEDASRIYLVSTEDLDAGASAGEANLYLHEAGDFTFIATLAAGDLRASVPSPIEARPLYQAARTTPDGGSLAFMSVAPLTGSDNTDANSGEDDAQVFVYDAAAERLICASCNATGARPSGRNIQAEEELNFPYWAAAQIPVPENQIYSQRVISDDGSRLFFESFEPLAHGDTNSKRDVYQWERLGAGDCSVASPTHNPAAAGCVSLISSGESPTDSRFLDADADGSNVFFTTTASLVASDPGQIDVYDARVGGGFPPPPPPPAQCEGEACAGTPFVPNDATPASSGYFGPANPAAAKQNKPKRCQKGKHKVKRKGKVRCVNKKAKNNKAKKSQNKRGARDQRAAARSNQSGGPRR